MSLLNTEMVLNSIYHSAQNPAPFTDSPRYSTAELTLGKAIFTDGVILKRYSDLHGNLPLKRDSLMCQAAFFAFLGSHSCFPQISGFFENCPRRNLDMIV